MNKDDEKFKNTLIKVFWKNINSLGNLFESFQDEYVFCKDFKKSKKTLEECRECISYAIRNLDDILELEAKND